MQPYEDKAASYNADVTYGTNSEFGFDYLRDNMATSLEEKVQRGHPFAVVDEVDNILIDEARTPLIISGQPEQAADLYAQFARLAKTLDRRQEARGDGPAHEEGVRRRLRLRVRGEAQDRLDHRAGRREGRALPRDRPPLPRRQRPPRQPPPAGAEGGVALQARQGLRRHRRRGQDHRRVHRPHPRGAPLVGGPAPGGGGEGGRPRPGREPDARPGHPPELLPHVRQARGHDRHRPHRGDRVHEDLQAAGRPDPHEHADGPQGRERPDLQDQGRQVARRGAGDRRAPRGRPAGPRRHDLRRGLRVPLRAAHEAGHQARGPQRQARVRRARGRDHRRGGPQRRGHHRDEHGRPRRRHQARRQRRAPDAARAGQARPQARRARLRRALQGDPPDDRGAHRGGPPARDGGRRPLHLRHRAPRVAPHRQPAPRPRRPPGRPRRVALLPLRRGRPRPPLRRRPHLQDPRPPRHRPTTRATRSPSRPGC